MEGPREDDQSAWSRFAHTVATSSRILCVVGAGLSAPSGLETWRGTNETLDKVNIKELASPKRFREDPVTVWNFYGQRLLEALAAQPNPAHHALAALARWHRDWLTVNQNVDGLLEQTNHPPSTLLSLHGTLKRVRCTVCDYQIHIQKPNHLPYLVSLANAEERPPSVSLSDLPHCPECANLLRPGIVWFGERLAAGAPDRIDEWISEDRVDLVIAAGTSLNVFPAAEWVNTVRTYGASLAIMDTDGKHWLRDEDELNDGDWLFLQDVAITLPRILELIRNQSQTTRQ